MTGTLQPKNGIWQMVLSYKNENGDWKVKWKTTKLPVKGNKKKAQDMLDDFLRKHEDKDMYTPESTFAEFLIEWLNFMKISNSVKANTWNEYRKSLYKDTIPYFQRNKIKLKELTSGDLQKYYNYLLANRDISANTIHKKHANIHKALKYATSLDLIHTNPADNVFLPKKQKYTNAQFYTIEQVNQLLAFLDTTTDIKFKRIKTPVTLACYYGFRRSEVLGLKWSAIDADKLTVEHTVVESFGGVLEEDLTKNDSSNRSMPMNSNIRNFLQTVHKKQLENKMYHGDKYEVSDYVCTWENGHPVKPDFLTRNFKLLCESADLPIIRFHDLRHTSASVLLSLGFTMKEIQEWLGHESMTTTSQFYAHLEYKAKENISSKLNGEFQIAK